MFLFTGVCHVNAMPAEARGGAEDPLELELETRDGCYPTMLPPDVTESNPHKRLLRVVSPKWLTRRAGGNGMGRSLGSRGATKQHSETVRRCLENSRGLGLEEPKVFVTRKFPGAAKSYRPRELTV